MHKQHTHARPQGGRGVVNTAKALYDVCCSQGAVNVAISGLLVALCALAAVDLWGQLSETSQGHWLLQYSKAVRTSQEYWNVGWRIEDLEDRLDMQQQRFKSIERVLSKQWFPRLRLSGDTTAVHNRQLRADLHSTVFNDSSAVRIACYNEGQSARKRILQVGVSRLRAHPMDCCQVFTSTEDIFEPQLMFTITELDDSTFALRALSNNNYVKVVPPPPEGAWSMPWKLVTTAPTTGAAERFRLSTDGLLYSTLMQGFFACGNDGMVKGYPGEYSDRSIFKLEQATREQLQYALNLKGLSDKVLGLQEGQAKTALSHKVDRMERSGENENGSTIALLIPMTSKGTRMQNVEDSPFWVNVFSSFMDSLDWDTNRFTFKFYLGFDKGDLLYDTGDAWTELRQSFRKRARSLLISYRVSNATLTRVLDRQLQLRLKDFAKLQGAPSQIVSELAKLAISEGSEYLYQINDDTSILSPNWAYEMVTALKRNPVLRNFGVTGPADGNNEKIFTHAFTHATHVEIFDGFFPLTFKNWWSDDWISTVYGSQKTAGTTRYQVDNSARDMLEAELLLGHVRIGDFLESRGLPRLTLPSVCGYAPAIVFASVAVEALTVPHVRPVVFTVKTVMGVVEQQY